jgi:tRNA modification GTPase
MKKNDTIAAVATPAGRGGIGVIRVSGPLCSKIASSMLGKLPKPRSACFASFNDPLGNVLDQGIALYFPHPHSFTGEDVLELQGHGGAVVLDRLLTCILQAGARMARPGEFSERAFLNNKIDLTQAEAIADLIDSASIQAAQAAIHSLQGVFSEQIHRVVEGLIALRTFVEAAIDFPEEEIDFLKDPKIEADLGLLMAQLTNILGAAHQGSLLREGMTIVIAGRPNAGKSSLLNQLSGKPTAIVTAVPGTTRDVLRERIHLDGLPLHILDTAGLHTSEDEVEQEGMRRALIEIEQADQILWIIDAKQQRDDFWPSLLSLSPDPKKFTLVHNKIDLTGEKPAIFYENDYWNIRICAKTGEGIEALKEHLKKIVGFNVASEGKFIARRRHLDALENALKCVNTGLDQFKQHRAGELLAEDLRQAQQILGEITGRFTSDDLLGRIFLSFCVGK